MYATLYLKHNHHDFYLYRTRFYHVLVMEQLIDAFDGRKADRRTDRRMGKESA
jgi:hypothetical protein